MIVDVDTHWEATGYAPGDHPLEPWLDQLPTSIEMLAFGIAGDLLSALPESERPSSEELLGSLVALARERGGPVILHPLHASTAPERVAWMDGVGTDHCLVNPGGYWQQLEFLGADRPKGVRRCNDFLTEQLADESEPAARGRGRRLRRSRRRRRRARAPRGRAARVRSSSTPRRAARPRMSRRAIRRGTGSGTRQRASAWSRWSTSVTPRPISPAGPISDGSCPTAPGSPGLIRLANTQRAHAAQNILSALLYGGVFARHPTLTVLLEEMRVNWIPPFVDTLSRQSLSSPILGDWPYDVAGGDMLRRNVRVTPLPGLGDTDALEFLAVLPEMCVFSSDFPHLEGNAEPIDLYRPALDTLDEELRARFLGDNSADCFAAYG